ncbi:MAG: glycosyltransferase family 2 protein [Lachnospiraceae bacterium]|nr:glycosyltransferase family 2 protein [Lachnospiraceae bacterium]
MKLVIQIPCYDEEETLAATLNDLPKQIPGIDEIETLVINDGSRDRTTEVALDWGVDHIVLFARNKGLARAFLAGLDVALDNGADIIVNTDADGQYQGRDIAALVAPVLAGKADIVIGERPIDDTADFSWMKKKLQHIGSYAVRLASATDIPDAPSGFRAISRDAALKLNVVNDYSYTLETIVQAGREKIPMTSVKIHTNPATRKSRLASSTWRYVRTSMLTILRAYLVYKPLKAFGFVSLFPMIPGILLLIRFLFFYFTTGGGGHVQSLILACTLIIIGFITWMIGVLGDAVSANRKILQDVQYHERKVYYSRNKDGEAVLREKSRIYYR